MPNSKSSHDFAELWIGGSGGVGEGCSLLFFTVCRTGGECFLIIMHNIIHRGHRRRISKLNILCYYRSRQFKNNHVMIHNIKQINREVCTQVLIENHFCFYRICYNIVQLKISNVMGSVYAYACFEYNTVKQVL